MVSMVVDANGETVNLRKKPSTGEKIVFERVPSDTIVQARQYNSEWHYVETPKGNKGYMMSDFLSPLDSGDSPGETPSTLPNVNDNMILVDRGLLRAVWQELGLMLKE